MTQMLVKSFHKSNVTNYLNCMRTGNDYKRVSSPVFLCQTPGSIRSILRRQNESKGSVRLVKTAICRKSRFYFRKPKSTREYCNFLKSCNTEIKQLSVEIINICKLAKRQWSSTGGIFGL